MLLLTVGSITTSIVEGFVHDLQGAFPRIFSGIVFLIVSAIAVRIGRWTVRQTLNRAFADTPDVYRQFIMSVAWILVWFGIGLAFLSIVGLGEIAAALGTATGFVALGVSYALSNMLADAVAGMYLLRDPDFNPGDEVTVGDITGTIRSIELRKTRFEVEGDTVVRGNADIEKRWTLRVAGD